MQSTNTKHNVKNICRATPNWNGCDEEVYNQIICLKNSSQQPILVLEKKGLQLLLTRVYDYDATKKTIKNGATAYVDLSKTLLKANQNYHFRIAWTDKAMPINGMIYLYLNGRLIAQAETYKTKDNSYPKLKNVKEQEKLERILKVF